MKLGKEQYSKALSEGVLYRKPVKDLLEELRSHLEVERVPRELLKRTQDQAQITKELSRLRPRVATGLKSWGGLVVGFPGSAEQLTTESVGTPYLRRILYPILDLHRRINDHYEQRLPCIYLLGKRFPDVFLRKFGLLASVTPHVIVLTSDLLNARHPPPPEPSEKEKVTEAWVQAWLCDRMNPNRSPDGLRVSVKDGDTQRDIQLEYLSHEMPTGEGTTKPERLDILGVDKADHSLVALEIKGPDCKRVELENLFLQGLEHRNWLESNKMAVKFIFDGPRGRRINTRKRVRLILGFFGDEEPRVFWELHRQARRHDRYLNIDLVRVTDTGRSDERLVLTRREE